MDACSVEVDGVKRKHNFFLAILLFVYCSVVTAVSRLRQLLLCIPCLLLEMFLL